MNSTPVTRETVDARYQRGKELMAAGQIREALEEYLWCFDTGMPGIPSYSGVRGSFLLSEIVQLGNGYPPALHALQVRRDQALQRMRNEPGDAFAPIDYASISCAMGEGQNVLQFYDQLSLEDPRRQPLLIRVYNLLLKARRYADALAARPFEKMAEDLKLHIASSKEFSGQQQSLYRRYVASTVAKDIEVLAGADKLNDARTLNAELFSFDSSAATLEVVRQHLIKVGHTEILTR